MSVPTTSSAEADRETYCWVYFIEAVGLDLIKIGYALDLEKRFTGLMTSSPAALTLLGVMQGGPRLETQIHTDLAEHRAHGEWFRKTPEVMAVVAKAEPHWGQKWLNQRAKVRGAALMEYLARMKRGEVVRPTRGPTRPSKRKSRDRPANPLS